MNYYERHLGDYARDTGHLSALEHGMYCLLLDRYYATEQPIPADQAHRLARARSRKEKAAADAVLKEFFWLQEDGWHNKRCDEEIARYREGDVGREQKEANEKERTRRHREERARLFAQLREHGITPAWNIPTPKLRQMFDRTCDAPVTATEQKLDDTCHAPVTACHAPVTANQTPDPIISSSLRSEERLVCAHTADAASCTEQPKRSPHGSRLPQHWQPSEVDVLYALEQGVDGRYEAEKFRDYWHSVAGAKGRKQDWSATWRTWIRRAAEHTTQSLKSGYRINGKNRSDLVQQCADVNAMHDERERLQQLSRGWIVPH